MYFDQELVSQLSKGAQVLGGGGGGREARGLKTAGEAMASGQVRLAELGEISPSDLVVTVSGVGAPSQSQAMYTARHYLRAMELLEQRLDRPIAGFIPSEMGGSAAFGPFLAAAVKGVPVINAACDGRAHPLGTMGALGLDRDPGYQALQAACGGRQEDGSYIELVTCASVRSASRASRLAAELAGGLDHGGCAVSAGGEDYKLYFYNEYMALQRGEERLATFPDLIATLDGETGNVVLTADMEKGRRVILLRVPYGRLVLGSGLRQREDYEGIERLLGISMVPFLKDFLTN